MRICIFGARRTPASNPSVALRHALKCRRQFCSQEIRTLPEIVMRHALLMVICVFTALIGASCGPNGEPMSLEELQQLAQNAGIPTPPADALETDMQDVVGGNADRIIFLRH